MKNLMIRTHRASERSRKIGKKPVRPVKMEMVTPEDFAAIFEDTDARRNLQSTRFVPPKFGSDGFGKFQVTYRRSILKETG